MRAPGIAWKMSEDGETYPTGFAYLQVYMMMGLLGTTLVAGMSYTVYRAVSSPDVQFNKQRRMSVIRE
jgi:hypothetical protein